MVERLKTYASIIIIIICLPYLVTFVVQGDFFHEEEAVSEESLQDEDTEQLILITANEMPLSYEKEALKAQVVIARTNLIYAREHDLAEPEGIARGELQSRLGAKAYQGTYEMLKSCVEETAGIIAVYKKELIQLPYTSVSAGHTRDAAELGPEPESKSGSKSESKQVSGMPYVVSVPSSWDFQSEHFLNVEFLSKKQYYNKLAAAFPDVTFPEDSSDISQLASIKKRDSASYVLIVGLPGQTVSGEAFKDALSLNSACFSIKEVDGQVRIVTKGFGQGFGMSQYGADQMAAEGSSFREILDYYYKGIKYKRADIFLANNE